MENESENQSKPWPITLLFLAWLGSLVGLLGSLYFSEILALAPCTLCWWQRIFMYPLVIPLPIGIAVKDRTIYRYTLPLAGMGVLVSIYQNLLYYGFIKKELAPCTAGVSCATKYLSFFGFLDIPQLALLGFIGITLFLYFFKLKVSK